MKKSNLKIGMILKTKANGYVTFEIINGKPYFRFKSRGDIISVENEYNENLECRNSNGTIIKVIEHNVIPEKREPIFRVKNLKDGEIFTCYCKKARMKPIDGQERELVRTRYSFNGNEGLDGNGYHTDYDGNITSDWFSEERINYYILQNGKKIFLQEDDSILVNEYSKIVVSFSYLEDMFEYLE